MFCVRFLPIDWNLKGLARSLGWLFVLGGRATAVIMGIYDVVIGPDPSRFGFLENLAMDSAFMGIHAILYAFVHRVAGISARR